MGFETLRAELCAACAASGDPAAAALSRVLQMPALLTRLKCNYEQSGPYKPFLKARIRKLAAAVATTTREGECQQEMRHLMDVLTERLAPLGYAADPDIKQWAKISVEMRADLQDDSVPVKVLDVLAGACDDKIAPLLQTTFSWMVSECNRRGVPMMPL